MFSSPIKLIATMQAIFFALYSLGRYFRNKITIASLIASHWETHFNGKCTICVVSVSLKTTLSLGEKYAKWIASTFLGSCAGIQKIRNSCLFPSPQCSILCLFFWWDFPFTMTVFSLKRATKNNGSYVNTFFCMW